MKYSQSNEEEDKPRKREIRKGSISFEQGKT